MSTLISNKFSFYPLVITEIYYDTQQRIYKPEGIPFIFPAIIKKSQVKFDFKKQSKPYAVIQDIPEYVSSVQRSYDLEFEVVAANKEEAIENQILLDNLLKNIKTTYERSQNLIVKDAGTVNARDIISNFTINNLFINSRANYRIGLASNPLIYRSYGNVGFEYDILMTAFDYKYDDSMGMVGSAAAIKLTDQAAITAPTLTPVSYSINISGILPPQNPNLSDNYTATKGYNNTIRLSENTKKFITSELKVKLEGIPKNPAQAAAVKKLNGILAELSEAEYNKWVAETKTKKDDEPDSIKAYRTIFS